MKNKLTKIQVCLLCLLLSCTGKRNDNVNNEGSMQPYEGYPFINNSEEILLHLKGRCIDTLKLKPGETIADVGAGNGYIEAMFSVFYDSITFYIQDIDTAVCNQRALDKVISFYQDVRGKPFTNKFITITGTDNQTNLPDSTFDRILMLWTYQYLKNPRTIITDLKLKLKNNGLLYVINPDIEYESGILLNKDFGWNASPVEKEISEILKCGFELIDISRNNFCCENPYIFVFKEKKTEDHHFTK